MRQMGKERLENEGNWVDGESVLPFCDSALWEQLTPQSDTETDKEPDAEDTGWAFMSQGKSRCEGPGLARAELMWGHQKTLYDRGREGKAGGWKQEAFEYQGELGSTETGRLVKKQH